MYIKRSTTVSLYLTSLESPTIQLHYCTRRFSYLIYVYIYIPVSVRTRTGSSSSNEFWRFQEVSTNFGTFIGCAGTEVTLPFLGSGCPCSISRLASSTASVPPRTRIRAHKEQWEARRDFHCGPRRMIRRTLVAPSND
jgi:hypothetical protein